MAEAGRDVRPAWAVELWPPEPPWPRCGFLAAIDFFSVDQRAFLGAPESDFLDMRIQLSSLDSSRLRLEPRMTERDHADEPQAHRLRPMGTWPRRLCRPGLRIRSASGAGPRHMARASGGCHLVGRAPSPVITESRPSVDSEGTSESDSSILPAFAPCPDQQQARGQCDPDHVDHGIPDVARTARQKKVLNQLAQRCVHEEERDRQADPA